MAQCSNNVKYIQIEERKQWRIRRSFVLESRFYLDINRLYWKTREINLDNVLQPLKSYFILIYSYLKILFQYSFSFLLPISYKTLFCSLITKCRIILKKTIFRLNYKSHYKDDFCFNYDYKVHYINSTIKYFKFF